MVLGQLINLSTALLQHNGKCNQSTLLQRDETFL